MKQKWEDELNQSFNQMTGVTLEESGGPCDFAFHVGDLTFGGQEGICALAHVGEVPREMEANGPG